MKTIFLLLATALALCSCEGFTHVKNDGSVFNSGGFLDEAEGQIVEIALPNGTKITKIYSRPNRTRVAGKAIDAYGSGVIANALSGERKHASTQETERFKEAQKPKIIEATAAGEERVIRATGETAAGLEKVKQGR